MKSRKFEAHNKVSKDCEEVKITIVAKRVGDKFLFEKPSNWELVDVLNMETVVVRHIPIFERN